MDWFKAVIMVQLFFAFSITMYTYALPDDARADTYVDLLSSSADDVDFESMAGDVQDSLE